MLEKISVEVPPLPSGKWVLGVSIPLLGGWVAAATTTRTDLFVGPFFWSFVYMLVVGIGLSIWGAAAMPITFPRKTPRWTPGAAKDLLDEFKRRVGLGSGWAVALDELALGVAFFFLFSAFVAR